MLGAENLQSNQSHAPGRRRRFYLAVHGRRLPTGLIQSPNERQSLPERDGMRFCSLGTIPVREVHEKTLRLRRERREIDDAADARRTIRLHIRNNQFGVRRGLRVRGEQRRASPAIKSKEATVRLSDCRSPITGESIAI
jgi:hypothetical protein